MRSNRWMAAAVGALLLNGCGGDGDNNPAPAPTPTPTPTPAPTPTPTPTNTTLIDLQASQTFASVDTALLFSRAADGTVSALNTQSVAVRSAFSFNATDRSYRYLAQGTNIQSGDFSSLFRPATRDSARSNNRFSVFSITQSGATSDLFLFNPGTGNDQLSLTYASFGLNRISRPDANGATLFDYRVFGWGLPTLVAQIPASGTATYNGIVRGVTTGNATGRVIDVTGTIAVTVNYGDRTFSGSIELSGTDDRTGQAVALGSYPLTSTTPGLDDMRGTIQSKIDGYRSNLAGPAAQELYGSFSFEIENPIISPRRLSIVAGFAGKK